MLEDVRRNVLGLVEAGMAVMSGKLTPTGAREVARGIVTGEGQRQVNRVAQDLLEWSQRSREWITEAISREVKRQLSALGIATREDLDALRKRVRELERGSGSGSAPAKKASPKKASPKKASPRKASAPGDSGPSAP